MASVEATTADANQVYLSATSASQSFSPTDMKNDSSTRMPTDPIPGPTVDSLPTMTYVLSSDQLLNSSIFPSYQRTVNRAYTLAHSFHKILSADPRVDNPEDYLFALRPPTASKSDGDDAFTIILVPDQTVESTGSIRNNSHHVTEDGTDRSSLQLTTPIYATISAHIWQPPAPTLVTSSGTAVLHPMKRAHAPSAASLSLSSPPALMARPTYWEIKLLAVDPSFQRRGLAGKMLQAVEKEIARRFDVAQASDPVISSSPDANDGISDRPKGRQNLIILISSIREINYSIYVQRGYEFHYETAINAGTLRSEKAFTLTHLFKRGVDV